MLFYYRKGKNAAKACMKICSVYGHDAVNDSTCRKWFRRFREGNFDVKDAIRTGRPVTTDDAEMKKLVQSDCHASTRQLALTLAMSATNVSRHLKNLGMVRKLDVWVPHALSDKNLQDRISACEALLKRNEKASFLKQIITGDEKWIHYNNVGRKRSWSMTDEAPQTVAKAGLHPKKIMLSVWWDYKGVLYYELLPQNTTINSTKYCSQIDKLKEEIDRKRSVLVNRNGVVFHHDNARPHVPNMTRQKLLDLGWDVLQHPPYSPDLAPSDYHLFRALQNSLNGLILSDVDACKKHLDHFFANKSQEFYKRGIFQLPDRWRRVIQQNGAYLIE